MKKQSKLERTFLSKPGDTLIETIEAIKMSQAELAQRMGKTASKINDLISGKEPITVNTALQLELVLGIAAEFWLTRETTYRERLARIEEEEKLECWVPWAQLHPLKELQKFGYLNKMESEVGAVKELLLFYSVVSPQQWGNIYGQQYVVNYRKSGVLDTTEAGLSSWLRMGEIDMGKLTLPGYNKDAFKEVLTKIRDIACHQPVDFDVQLKKLCLRAGVAVIFSRGLPKAPISGAARWIGGNPLIQLTDRYKINDRFWFTFFHEAAHILLHGKKDTFLEDVENLSQDRDVEEEANSFAAKFLLPEKFIADVCNPITDENIQFIASKYKMHPGIVVGRLQKLEMLPYGAGNKFKERLSLFQ